MYSLEGRPMLPPPRKGSSFVGNPVYDVQNECRIPKENTLMFMLSLHLTLR